MGLPGGRIRTVTALDGASKACLLAELGKSRMGALCQNPLATEGGEEVAPSRDLLRLPRAVRGRGDGDGSPQPHATCTPVSAPLRTAFRISSSSWGWGRFCTETTAAAAQSGVLGD